MNNNLFQTILTIAMTISGLGSTLLVSLGCKTNVVGNLDCTASNAPIWLVPYMVMAASALGILKLIVSAFNGKLVKPTVVVSTTGEAGTVRPSAVQ